MAFFAPWGNQQFVTDDGSPASGWKLYSYLAGSSTPATTYCDEAGTIAQTNPIVLDTLGFVQSGQLWFAGGTPMKLVLTDENDVAQKTEDNLVGVNDSSVSVSEWITGPTPTYISGTSFSVSGDQTTVLNVGRRIKSGNSGGSIYSTITASVFGAVTTVTVENDSGSLDAGLASIEYGIVSAANSSIPVRRDTIPLMSDPADPTKRLRLDVGNIPTATTVVASTGAGGLLPAGIGPLPYSGSSIPTGWLACDGSAISRTTYAALFTAIGTTWGVGDGVNTFNLPDARGKSPIGDGTGTVTEAVTASSGNGFTVASNSTKWITGMTIVLSNLSGYTTSATAGPTYYAVRISATNVRLATTLALAQEGAPDVTLSGSGTATLTHTFTARTLGEYGGEQTHAITRTEQLAPPANPTSNYLGAYNGANADAAGGTNASFRLFATTGGNAAMNNMQPFLVTKYIISY